MISFCAVANFAPGLVLGLYWQRAHRFGVVAGLVGGFVVWLYALLLPTLRQEAGDGLVAPFMPYLPEPLATLDPVLQGFLVCLVVNTALLVGVSLAVRPVGRDREQADAFVLGAEPKPATRRTPADAARIEELRQLLARFVGVERAARALSGELSMETAVARTERMLSGTLGAASARIIVAASNRRGRLLPRSARAIIDEASEAIRYNYEILRNTLDHVGMGIAAFDRDGRLEIFNDRFTALLALDDDAVAVGVSPREFGATLDVVALLRRPEMPQTHEIATRGGRVIELRLDPLPGDGFVATCNDVTARVHTAQALRDSDGQLRRAAETLEQRVVERTAQLEASRAEAEAANLGKTRFIAAASHDLLQPLHAARLFTAAMIDRDPRNDLGGKIDASLGAVESLLDALLDISKLDAGAFKPEKRPFALQPLFESLATAFAPMAARRGVELVVAPTLAFVDTDPSFLRRILQNLLSNALRYGRVEGRPARVLLGCRRVEGALRIEVRDNGPGIAPDKQAVIFDEFVRLQPEDEGPREERGLGLGLAIVDRIARMLELPVTLASEQGSGSTFSVTVPRVAAFVTAPSAEPVPQPMLSIESESFVLCLDNEARVREAMAALLGGWGCNVATAASQAEALDAVARAGRLPDLVLADLHLDEGADGPRRCGGAARGLGPRRARRIGDRRPRPDPQGAGAGAAGRAAAQASEAGVSARASAVAQFGGGASDGVTPSRRPERSAAKSKDLFSLRQIVRRKRGPSTTPPCGRLRSGRRGTLRPARLRHRQRQPARLDDGLRARADAELAQDHRHVRLHRRLADAELVRDLLVLVALHHQRQHAPLLRRELRCALGEGIGRGGLWRREDLAVEHGAHDAGDLVQRGRLLDVGRGAELVGALHDGGLARRRDDDDGNGGMLGPQPREAGEAVHARHVEIEQHGIGLGLAVEGRFCLVQGAGHAELRPGESLAERRRQRVANHRVVVGYEEAFDVGHGARVTTGAGRIKLQGGDHAPASRDRDAWAGDH